MSRGTREYDRQVAAALRRTAAERILLLDGAMGTEIQKRKPGEADYRGERFAAWPRDVKGNNDLLCLTRPDLVREIHRDYFAAGADLVETNTFNAQRISQADYGMEDLAVEINAAAAALARSAADEVEAATGVRRYVAGALGPTNRTLSLSPDVNNPGYRAVTFDEVRSAYAEQTRALIEGGVDVLLVETIFDTLNAKAAIFAIEEVQEEMGREVPLMLSVTVTDASGRTLSGQTVGAFWTSVAHARPLSVGLNCALGAAEMRPYLEELAREADCLVSCYPNAGLPNAFGGYDETPEAFSSCLHGFAREGWLNIAGGCCGTGPEHVRRLSEMLRGVAPRPVPARRAVFRLSGLEALVVA